MYMLYNTCIVLLLYSLTSYIADGEKSTALRLPLKTMVTQLSGSELGGQHLDSGNSAHLQKVPSMPLHITRT